MEFSLEAELVDGCAVADGGHHVLEDAHGGRVEEHVVDVDGRYVQAGGEVRQFEETELIVWPAPLRQGQINLNNADERVAVAPKSASSHEHTPGLAPAGFDPPDLLKYAKMADIRETSDLSHWDTILWTDYPNAYVRLLTLRADGVTRLLFASVELVPTEIPLIPGYDAPSMKLGGGGIVRTSLTVMTSKEAVRWYEQSVSGIVSVPASGKEPSIYAVPLAPEPLLGRWILAEGEALPISGRGQFRMHRMVPMESLHPSIFSLLHSKERDDLRRWISKECFVELAAHPDCAGAVILFADNPILRRVTLRPTRSLPNGSEVLFIRLVPRIGHSLDGVRARVIERRPGGVAEIRKVCLDELGEAEVILPQSVREVGFELICAKRGPLVSHSPTGFIRTIRTEIMPIRNTMEVEVPGRNAAERTSRHKVSVSGRPINTESVMGTPLGTDPVNRLNALIASRTGSSGDRREELLFTNRRDEAIQFVHELVSVSRTQVLFVDPYFSFTDIRAFMLAFRFASCKARVLTSAKSGWTGRLMHFSSAKCHGDLMSADIEGINQSLKQSGLSPIEVMVMRDIQIHDRFLVVDDAIWSFGCSFNSIGDGELTMVSKVRDVKSLLPRLLEAVARADPFETFWRRAKAQVPAPPGGHHAKSN